VTEDTCYLRDQIDAFGAFVQSLVLEKVKTETRKLSELE